MIRRPPRATRTDTLVPYTTRFRSDVACDVTQTAGLRGAARCVGLRVEEHEDLAPLVVGELDLALGLVEQRDRRGLVTGGERHGPDGTRAAQPSETASGRVPRDRKSTRLNSSH